MKTRLIRLFENAIYHWDGASRVRNNPLSEFTYGVGQSSIFAFFREENILVLARLTQAEREGLAADYGAVPALVGGRVTRRWWEFQLTEENLSELLPYVQRSYQRAVAGTHFNE